MTRDKEERCMELVKAINEKLSDSQKDKHKFTLSAVIHKVHELSDNTSLICYEQNGVFSQLKTNKSKAYWESKKCIKQNVIINGSHASDSKAVDTIYSVRLSNVDDAILEFTESDINYYEEMYETFDGLTEDKICKLLEQQKDLLDFSGGEEEVSGTDMVSYKELVLKFAMLMTKYRQDTRKKVMNIINKYQRVKSDEQERLLKRLQFYVNYIGGVSGEILEKKSKTIRHQLDEVCEGQYAIKDSLCELLSSYQSDPLHKAPRIFIQANGGHGIEKLVRSFFELTGMAYGVFSCAGMDDVSNILGSSAVYSNATLGTFAETLLNTSQGGMLIKDIDRVKKAEVALAFQTIIDGAYKNELLDGSVDVSSEWFIFIVSDLDEISLDIDRAQVLEAKEYTDEEMMAAVCKEKTVFCMENSVEEQQICLTNEVISDIALRYSRKSNIVNAQTITREILWQALLQHGKKNKVLITRENLQSYFLLLNEEMYFRNTYVKSVAEIEKKLMLCGDKMPDTIRACVEKLLDEYDSAMKEEKAIIEKKLVALGNLLKKEFIVDMEHLKKELTASISGMEDVVEKILDQIYAATSGTKHVRFEPIILEGKPGVGKTTIADAIGRGLGIPVVKLAFNQISDSRELTGYSCSLGNEKPGLLGMLAAPNVSSLSAIVLIDELDKPVLPSMFNPLYNWWDKQNAWDEYYECSFNTDGLLFICTANELSKVPYSLKNRCQIINVSSYTMIEQMRIASSFIIPKVLKDFGLESEIIFSDETIWYILENYTFTAGVREMERNINTIIRRLIRTKVVKTSEPIEVTKDIIKECLGTPVYGLDKCPLDNGNSVGVARALAVSGHGGISFGIEVADNPYGADLEITGLAKNSLLESIKVALNVAQRMLNQEIKKIHMHFNNAGIEKDGPSAGISILAALLSYCINRPLGNVAFSGELTLGGQIQSIGGLKEKLIAAERAKTETVYIPLENYAELKDKNELELFSLNIVPVDSVGKLASYLFPGYELG